MPKRYSSREVIKALEKKGFVYAAQKGSHVKYRKSERVVIVPAGRKQIPVGTMHSILRQAGLKESDLFE